MAEGEPTPRDIAVKLADRILTECIEAQHRFRKDADYESRKELDDKTKEAISKSIKARGLLLEEATAAFDGAAKKVEDLNKKIEEAIEEEKNLVETIEIIGKALALIGLILTMV